MPPGSFRRLESHDGETIRVRWVKKIRSGEPGCRLWAYYDPNTRTITIAHDGCTPGQLVDSMIHELLHDIIDAGSDEIDEDVQHQFIEPVVPQLVEFLVNNPKLSAWIEAQLKAERARRSSRMAAK